MSVRGVSWQSLASRFVVFLAVWWALSEGRLESWWFGLPAVLVAVALSLRLIPPTSLRWLEVLRFLPFFVRRSLLGGADVAWRAVHPRLPIDPVLVRYPVRLPRGLPQVTMINLVSLLPGTLGADIQGDVLTVHALDGAQPVSAELQHLEQRVALLFGVG